MRKIVTIGVVAIAALALGFSSTAQAWCPRGNGETACVQVYAGWFHSDGTWGGGSTADLYIENVGQNTKACNGRDGASPLYIDPLNIADFYALRQITCQPGNFSFEIENGLSSTCLNGGFWHDNHYWRSYWQDPINPGQISIYLCTDRPS